MALTPGVTPREKLDRLLQYVVRARRYWWLVAGLVVLGAVLSVAFAMTRPKVYESGAVLLYQEKIQTSLLQNRDVSTMHRNIGERYRELLLARSSLVEVVRDPKINPFPHVVESDGEDAAVEELREMIDFHPRGANTFIISYKDSNPTRARDVTQRLTELLQTKEAKLRLDQAETTANFAEKLRAEQVTLLRQNQSELNTFLVAHPEFAIDAAEGSGEGASIRASQEDPNRTRPATPAERMISDLERQRARLKARIANPDAPPPPRAPRTRTAAQIAADQRVADAQRELDAAERALGETLSKVTDRHPDAVKARERITNAKQQVASAKAAVPPDPDEIIIPAGPVDKGLLESELTKVERQIAAERARQRGAAPPPEAEPPSQGGNWVVALEDEYQRLKLAVDEQRLRVTNLADSAFKSKLEAEQRAADSQASLAVVDPAYKPLKPIGKPKKMLVMAGVVLFTLMGCGLALGLAVIDDRIYRRHDLDAMGLAPTLAVIPRARVRQPRARRASRA
jgi:capsular polysaccharide biosynthesis protein